MTTAAIYARLSRDRDGTSTGTDRQLADCRALAKAKGWDVVGEYVERDVSAYTPKTPRPRYDAMLTALEAGEVGVIVAWKLDRLLRRPLDFETLWDRLERKGASLATVADSIDTTQPIVGELVPRLLTSFAKLESQNLSTREKRKHEETAAAGRPAGGGYRPFGLRPECSDAPPYRCDDKPKHSPWARLVDDEADAIRTAVDALIAGDTSLYGIARDWNDRQIPTPTGRKWNTQLVRSMLRSPRLAGARLLGGELIVTGAIPAILTVDTFTALEVALNRRAPVGVAGRFLLSGVLRCAVCGSTLYVRRRHRDKRRFYGCEKVPGGAGCGKVHIVAEPLEEYVTGEFLAAIDSRVLAEAVAERERELDAGHELEGLEADEAALRHLATDYYVDRAITREEYFAAREPVEARLTATRERIARQAGATSAAEALGTDRTEWHGLPLDARRGLLAELIESIAVSPASRRGAPFEAERASIRWRY
jgi:DNA invertase Pin-like site-specific DNA recombinase